MKPSILLLAASAIVAPLSAQDNGPGTDLIDLFEKSQREGATDEQLRQMLDDKALLELRGPEVRDPGSDEGKRLLEELLGKDAEQERFRPLLDEREPMKPGRAKETGEPRWFMEVTEEPTSDSPNSPSRWIVGLVVKPLVPALRSHFDLPGGAGVLVESVMSGSPAAQAGIKPNDIVVSANGRKISSLEDLRDIVEKAGSNGQQVHLEVIHRGKRNIAKVEPLDSDAAVQKPVDGGPAAMQHAMTEIHGRFEAQQREIERLQREVAELRERINRE